MKEYSLKPLILGHDIQRPILWSKQFGRLAPLEVEIGFGLGEFLIRNATAHPDRDYVGIEQHWERMTRALAMISKLKAANLDFLLDNIYFLKIDARVAFERLFGIESIDRIHCLFPCPWPKKGHARHRLFSNAFLKLLNSRLKQNGDVTIVTDSQPYRAWVQEQLDAAGFESVSNLVEPCYDTKFERKWKAHGQRKFYELKLVKTFHIDVPFKEDTPLRSFILKEFDPERFHFKNQIGVISVVFKEALFDPSKNKMMVYLVVSEEEFTQHFWVAIIKKENLWCVCKADGQSVLPTLGIARAIELVYEQARSAK